MNKVFIKGNLGGNPELRYTNNGKAVCKLRIATREKDKNVAWHNVVIWDAAAEMANRYLSKGKEVLIEGRIAYREYVDKSNITVRVTEIVAMHWEFCGPKTEDMQKTYGSLDEIDKTLNLDTSVLHQKQEPIIIKEYEQESIPF